MRNSVILAVTAAALASSFLVPSDAFAANRGFAHAARASRSVHAASTGSVRAASVGVRRSFSVQRPVSSGRVASGSSFTQRRFGSANTAVGHSISFGNHFSMANRTMGHTTTATNTPQFNKLASNDHALTGPQAANGQAGKSTQALSSAQVIADLTKRASVDKARANKEFDLAHRASVLASYAEDAARIDRRAGDRFGALKEDHLAAAEKVQSGVDTKFGDNELKTAKIDTTAANEIANKGSSDKTGSGGKTGSGDKGGSGDKAGSGDKTGTGTGGKIGTGGKGGGAGDNTNANNTPVGGNHPQPFPGSHPFPGQFPGTIGMGQRPFVGGQVAVGGSIGPVAIGGTVAPVAVVPVASTGGALPPLTRPSAPRPPAPSCLTKTYLQAGLVMFRDVCSQEWAMNSSSITNPAPTSSACLSKENPQNGVVLFKDNCTSEWAMNPQPDTQAQN